MIVRSPAIKHLRQTSAWLVAPGLPAEELARARVVLEMLVFLTEQNYPENGQWLTEMTADAASRAVSTAATRSNQSLDEALINGYLGAMRLFAVESDLKIDSTTFDQGMAEFKGMVVDLIKRYDRPKGWMTIISDRVRRIGFRSAPSPRS